MKLSEWIHQDVQADGTTSTRTRLVVRNLTRQTVIASELEVASQGANRRKGLLGRDGLAPGSGLWIKPCEAVHTFFMRFPIDLVYLDRKHRVRKVRRSVGPWRISGCLTAHSVIELPAGAVEASHTRAGDLIEFATVAARAEDEQLSSPAQIPMRQFAVSHS